MHTQTISSLVPENTQGKLLDIEHHVIEDSLEMAIKTFERAAARLVNPPVWHLLAGDLSANFYLYSQDSNNKRLAVVNDYFSIDIPGPGSTAGDGLDWVKVEVLQKDMEPDCDESVAMTLRASKNPENATAVVAHFFKEEATSTFVIKRTGNTVSVSYHGRNEVANTTDVPLVDKLRNTVVATGAKVGLSDIQWELLIKGFLQSELGG